MTVDSSNHAFKIEPRLQDRHARSRHTAMSGRVGGMRGAAFRDRNGQQVTAISAINEVEHGGVAQLGMDRPGGQAASFLVNKTASRLGARPPADNPVLI